MVNLTSCGSFTSFTGRLRGSASQKRPVLPGTLSVLSWKPEDSQASPQGLLFSESTEYRGSGQLQPAGLWGGWPCSLPVILCSACQVHETPLACLYFHADRFPHVGQFPSDRLGQFLASRVVSRAASHGYSHVFSQKDAKCTKLPNPSDPGS